ncbi:unnamed protein product [Calypogeia fissa]
MAPAAAVAPSGSQVHVRDLNEDEVPQRYKWLDKDLRDGLFVKPTETSKLGSGLEEKAEDESLPILDLSILTSGSEVERTKLAMAIGRAAESWGFFQVINHGVPDDVIAEMEENGRRFFDDLPLDVKERGVETDPGKHTYYHGYGGRFQHLTARVPWLEYLGECYHPINGVDGLLQKVHPGVGDPKFCKAADAYSEALVKLGRQILELLAESLDLSPDFFSQHFSDSTRYQAHWRFNHYPRCPEPTQVLGLAPHTDPCGITIVRQDQVGGFQLKNKGHWYDVQPLEGSFLINIGDCLEAWSNGRFSSVLHRAVVNETIDRLSIVFPFSPAADFDVCAPPSLIDDAHPLRYPSPIEWHHLAVIKGNHVSKEALSAKFGLKMVTWKQAVTSV